MLGPLRRGPGGLQYRLGTRPQQLSATVGPRRGFAQVAAAAHPRTNVPAAARHEAGRVAFRRDIGRGPGAAWRRPVQSCSRCPGSSSFHRLLQSQAPWQCFFGAVQRLLGSEFPR